jgi:hypothetical protein
MPLTIKRKGGKHCVVDPAGKQFGCHATRQGAVNQIGAIESNKSKSGIDLMAEDKIRILAAELQAADHGVTSPPIMIMSDGTPEGTELMVHGQVIPFKRVSIYCSNDSEYPHCDISITMEQSDDNGLVVEKTLTLRKEN